MKKFATLLPIFLLLSACDKVPFGNQKQNSQASVATPASAPKNIETAISKAVNPCLDKELIQGVKEGILDRANELIITKESQEFANLTYPLLQEVKITFYNISEPHKFMDKENVCEANVQVEYIGDDDTQAATVQQLAKFLGADLPYSSSPIGQIFTGQAHQKQLEKFGLNKYNLDDIRRINGNTFESSIKYTPETTYTEDGQARQGWEAYFGQTSSLIATTAAYDILLRYAQQSRRNNTQNPQQPEASESIAAPSNESEVPPHKDSPTPKKNTDSAQDRELKQKEWNAEQARKAEELDKALQEQLNSASEDGEGIKIK